MRFDWRGSRTQRGAGSDRGLEVAVAEFRRALTPIVAAVVAGAPSGEPEQADRDVVLEAYNLACGFIDADGLATDAELAALLSTFSPLLDERFAATTPEGARKIGLTETKRTILDAPTPMFELLIGIDGRDGSDHATTYLQHAVAIGHMVASLDSMTSRTELEVIEGFRGRLLHRITAGSSAGTPGSGDGSRAGGDPTTAGHQPPNEASDAEQGAGEDQDADLDLETLGPPRPIDELLAELDALIGLEGVKHEVHLVTDLLRVQQLRANRGLATLERSHHLVFTGNPGTGKTTVARLVAQIYRTLGVVSRGQLVETDRSGLVAGFVGQTATKVVETFDRADGGILLIDEAYSLIRGSERDFGREAIDMIVKLSEDRRDRTVVIMAGYPDEMDGLLDSNPGLRSRFPTTIEFGDYTDDELVAIFELLATAGHYIVEDSTRKVVKDWFARQPRGRGFGNGRLARNLFEATVGVQAGRIVDDHGAPDSPTDLELVTLLPADVPPVETDQDASTR